MSEEFGVESLVDQYDLTWLEEPLNAYDYRGHAQLRERLDTPIATGEMLSSVAECTELISHESVTFLQPDAPRVGGITPFLKVAAQADMHRLKLAPHFVMEIHVHLACAYPNEAWVEHIEWLEPAFTERLEIKAGRMLMPTGPGLGSAFPSRRRLGASTRVASMGSSKCEAIPGCVPVVQGNARVVSCTGQRPANGGIAK